MIFHDLNKSLAGGISISILIVGLSIAVAAGGLVALTSSQFSYSQRNEAREKALTIAEAGVQYYRWHLAHAPEDYTDGTGEPGPYEHEYRDPQGDVVGYYSLEITPPEEGYTSVTITSTGWTVDYPGVRRTVQATYGIPSLARFSFLHNANVWFGSGLTVNGRVLSNGGIRQDGVNTSIISSAKETYTCGQETGCSPSQERPGVWGSGGPSELWDYPVPAEDFDAISVDFNQMRTAAQTDGVYLAPSSDWGYHLDFQADGTVDVFEVRNVQRLRGYDSDSGCINLYQRIQSENLIGNYSLEDNRVLFAEDTLWVEGIVNGKMSVVAARFPMGSFNEDIWINNSLVYQAQNGDHALGLIAQDDIYFGRDIPEDFHVHAALLAQNGKVVRHHYDVWWCGGSGNPNAVKDKLTIFGALISNQKSYWNWGSAPDSGFEEREVTYDANLRLGPPPYFPSSGDYEFVDWNEVDN